MQERLRTRIIKRVVNVKLSTRRHVLTFTTVGSLLIMAVVSLIQMLLAMLTGADLMLEIARGLFISGLIAPASLYTRALSLQKNGQLAHRYRNALRVANRNTKALEEKNIELEEAHLRLAEIANSDYLTGLANRRRFQETLESAFADAQAGKRTFALHLLDLNAFKSVNDTHGHDAGDAILRHTSVRIRKLLADCEGMAARLGGDEFAVLLWDVDNQRELAQFSSQLAEMIAEPQGYRGEVLKVTATVGSTLYRDSYASADEMFIATDRRMLAHKHKQQHLRAPSRRAGDKKVAV